MKALLTTISLCFILLSFSQDLEYIHETDGESEFVTGVLTGNSIVVGGSYTEKYSFVSKGLLILLDENRKPVWTKKWEEEDSKVLAIQAINDRIIVLLRIERQTIVTCFDLTGKELWNFSELSIDQPVSLIALGNGSFVVMGVSEGEDGKDTIYVVLADFENIVQWIKPVKSGERVKPLTMALLKDNLYVSGYERVNGDHEVFLLDVPLTEKKIKERSLDEMGFKYPFSLAFDQQENLLIGGESLERKAFLARTSKKGGVVWTKPLAGSPGNFRIYSVATSEDNDYLVSGRYNDAKSFLNRYEDDGYQKDNQIIEGVGKFVSQQILVLGNDVTVLGSTLDNRSKSSGYLITLNDFINE